MFLAVIYSILLYAGLTLAAFGGWKSYRAIRHEAKGKRLPLEILQDLAALKERLTFDRPPTQTVGPEGIASAAAFGTAHIELSGAQMSTTGELNLSEIQRLEKRVENAEKLADQREHVRQKEADQQRTELITLIEKIDLRGRNAQSELDKIDAEALDIQMRGVLWVSIGLVLSILATVLDTLFTIEHSTLFG